MVVLGTAAGQQEIVEIELPASLARGLEAIISGAAFVVEKAVEDIRGVPVVNPTQIVLLPVEPGTVAVLVPDGVSQRFAGQLV